MNKQASETFSELKQAYDKGKTVIDRTSSVLFPTNDPILARIGTVSSSSNYLDKVADTGRLVNTVVGEGAEKASGAGGIGNPVEVVGKGNTGRIKPNTLSGQMAMHEVMSNPLKNATELPIKMKDTRWPFEDGWVKMQNNVKLSNGDTVSIHYVYNKKTGLFDDFKFK